MVYKEPKKQVREHLRLAMNESNRLFQVVQKSRVATWSQFASRRKTLFWNCTASHDIKIVVDLTQLMIVNILKQAMLEEMQTYALHIKRRRGRGFQSRELTELADNFEKCFSDRRS